MKFLFASAVLLCILALHVSYTSAVFCRPQPDQITIINNYYGQAPYYNSDDTPQKQAINFFYHQLILRDYAPLYDILAENVHMEVIGFLVLDGRDLVYSYLYFGDPDITDLFQLIAYNNILHIQEGLRVGSQANITILVVATNVTYYQPTSVIYDFNEQNEMSGYIQFQDTLGTSEKYPQLGTPNVTDLCHHIVTSTCVGIYQQWSTETACRAFMNSIRVIDPDNVPRTTGNSQTCRNIHERLARASPSHHCIHCGPTSVSAAATPCNDYS